MLERISSEHLIMTEGVINNLCFQLAELERRVVEAETRADEAEDKVRKLAGAETRHDFPLVMDVTHANESSNCAFLAMLIIKTTHHHHTS